MVLVLQILLWLALAPQAWSASKECAPVDLRDRLGAPFHQGDTGFCFAHTSADLLTAKLGFRVSPFHLATQFVLANPGEIQGVRDAELRRRLGPPFLRKWRADRNAQPENFLAERILTMNGILFTGGEEEDVLLLANVLGLCAEERLPSGQDLFPAYAREIQRYHAERSGRIPPEERDGQIGEVVDPGAKAMAWSFRHWVEGRCGSALRPAQTVLPESLVYGATVAEYLQRLQNAPTGEEEAKRKLGQAINSALDRGQPVAIGYSANDIMPRDPRVPDGDHSSILAARRRVGRECFYFLRNSFGEAREQDYLKPFHGRLERGGVWLRLKELPSLYSAVWLR